MKTRANSALARRWALVLVTAIGIQATLFAGRISASPLDGMVACWRADSNALDSAAGHHGGRPYGIAYAPSHSGKGFDFDGSRRRVSIADHPAFYLTNSLTLECWVCPRRWGGFIVFRGDNRSGLDPWQLDAYEPGYVRFKTSSTRPIKRRRCWPRCVCTSGNTSRPPWRAKRARCDCI